MRNAKAASSSSAANCQRSGSATASPRQSRDDGRMMSSFVPSGASVASVTDRVLKVELKAPATAVHFTGDVAAFVSGEESVVLVDGAGAGTEVAVHGGGILCSVSDGRRLVTGGDDGKVVVVDAKGKIETLAAAARHRWIDNVAVHADGSVAWSAGLTAVE